jgi:hypothetical protein
MMLVTVFGGTGFLGHHIVEALAREARLSAWRCAIPIGPSSLAVRTEGARIGRRGRDEGAVAAAVAGADGVVDGVSTYVERGSVTYRHVHERGAGNQPLDVVFRRLIDDFDSSFLIARRMSACSRFDFLESSGSAGVAV